MSKEWYATCKDCRQVYGYSDDSYRLGSKRGMSRPERCPKCRKLHSREISTLGLSHFDLTPILPIPATGLNAGGLGGLVRPARVHKLQEKKPTFDLQKFGIKDAHIKEYFEILQEKQVTVIVAPTGAGKSTFLPYRLMVPPIGLPGDLFTRNGQIVITQPRIQATRNIPLFVARDLHGSNLGAGFDVGFRHSGNPSTDWRNKLVYMTDGTLINMIIRNELGKLSVIMIDEAHERSLNIDLILGLLRLQLSRHPNLKLIIASATINAGLFLEYFGGPAKFNPDVYAADSKEGYLNYDNKKIQKALKNLPVGFYGFPGKRQYPVDTRYFDGEPIPEQHWAGRMPEEMAKKVLEILHDMETGAEPVRGDILGFLHGEVPIQKAVELIQAGVEENHSLAGKVTVLPLYTKLPQGQQDQALLPKGNSKKTRVVISTNVAETSLTVDGIVHVVDSGLINESQWDSKTQTSYVVPKIHSQSGCKQRWGRGGRIQAGVAHCLYTKDQFDRFPKYTDPEILRAPLDQIVLTAKAAGVDDIQGFKWIEKPSLEELNRAPHYLEQIGAVDRDGDLTEHGLELRNFGDEVDTANLMILADRFGCAVEMATILSMRKVGGYPAFLRWDKGWDAVSKRAVHMIHQGFIGACRDDLEFSLKLWSAWEKASSIKGKSSQAQQWARRYFINSEILKNQITEEREGLLHSLSGHKKDEVYRPVDFNLLNRLRILMVYGLPNQIYLLDNATDDSQELDKVPTYTPYIAASDQKPELELLHAGASVEVSPASVCSDKAIEAFVCGKRQRTRRRISPLSEPLTIITASFVVAIKPKWLEYLNSPIMSLARRVAEETRHENGALINTDNEARLFLDQYFPIGTTINCRKTQVEGLVEPYQIVTPAPLLQPRRSNEDVETPGDVENLEPESRIRSTGVRKEDTRFIVDVEEEEVPVNWLEDIESSFEEDFPDAPLPKAASTNGAYSRVKGQVVYSPPGITETKLFRAVIVGYDFHDPDGQRVLLERPAIPDSFEVFCSRYKVGAKIQAEITSLEEYVNDRLVYLVAREKVTGYEIILDPYDASLGGRNFAVRRFTPGETIDATVEAIDQARKRVRVTCLQDAEAEFLKFAGKGEERVLEARIVEVRENGLYVWVDHKNQTIRIPISAFVHIDRLPQRPEEMVLELECKVKVNSRPRKNGYRRGIGDLPDEDLELLKKHKWSPKIEFDAENRTITIDGRLSYHQKVNLLNLCSHSEYQKAINILFRRSNELDVRILDLIAIDNLSHQLAGKTQQKWKIVRVHENSVVVRNEDGLEVPVPKSESDFDRNVDLRQKFKEGKYVKVDVKKINPETGQVAVSLKDPVKDPLRKYEVDQVVSGKIKGWTNDQSGMILEIAAGVEGYVHKDQLAFEREEQTETSFPPGHKVKARIMTIDLENRRMKLSVYGLYVRRMSIPPDYNSLVIGRDGNTIRNIENSTRAIVDLRPDGTCEIAGPAPKMLKSAESKIAEILATCLARFSLDDTQARQLIGRSGDNVRNIQTATNTLIHVNQANQVTLTAPNRPALNKSLKLIAESVSYYRALISVPVARMGMIIGTRGATIQKIERSAGVSIQTLRDRPGHLYIQGSIQEEVEQARALIQSISGYVETVEVLSGAMPGRERITLTVPPEAKTKIKGSPKREIQTRKTKMVDGKKAKLPRAGNTARKNAKKVLSNNKRPSKASMKQTPTSLRKKKTK